MSRIAHSLVGYGRHAERVVEEFVVPDAVLPRAKEIARVPPDDPDAIMCYPLAPPAARNLAQILGARVDTELRDYFPEGLAVPVAGFDE